MKNSVCLMLMLCMISVTSVTASTSYWISNETTFNNGLYDNTTLQNISYVSLNYSGEYPPDISMVGHWHMNESSGDIIDYSGRGNDGSYNGVLYSQSGVFNTAIGFDGINDMVDVGNDSSINFEGTDAFTLSAWIKQNVPAVGRIITKKDISGGDKRGYSLVLVDDGRLTCTITNDYSSPNQRIIVYSVETILSSKWNYVVMTYNGNESASGVQFYINGKPVSQTVSVDTLSGTIKTLTPLLIGAREDGLNNFNGSIEEVAVYNRSLTPTEIKAHYLKQKGTYESPIFDCGLPCKYFNISWETSQINNLTFRVRSDDDNISWGNWLGSDGTSNTFYNTTPTNLVGVENNTYFQWKAYFNGDGVTTPQLYDITVGYTNVTTTTTTTLADMEIVNCTPQSSQAIIDTEVNITSYIKENGDIVDDYWFTFNKTNSGIEGAVDGYNIIEHSLIFLGTGRYYVVCFVNNTLGEEINTSTQTTFFNIITTTTIITETTTSTIVAILENYTVPDKVFLNDIISARVRLKNSATNSSLDGQDCSVVAYENDTGRVIKWWDTQCKQGEPYVDNEGNWATYTNCPLSDTNGNYYFTGKITEKDGFQYDKYYTLELNCNRKSVSQVFYVDVSKPIDVTEYSDRSMRYIGYIIFIVISVVILILLLLIILFTLYLLWKTMLKILGK